ncbi:XRE family transcriptional regulator [Kordiimonas sp.]|uniref:XRE family transcriptional regulator n=1 Tax=Kordiimonas sp. TaxID=1970157 RepID=UPI003A8EB05C
MEFVKWIFAVKYSELYSDSVLFWNNSRFMENRIKEIREAKGWRQADLASAVGCTQGQINKLETGTARLSDVWLAKIAPVLGVPQGALLADGVCFDKVQPNIKEIPVIDYVQAGKFSDGMNAIPTGEADETVHVDYKHNNIFGLKVRGNSMDRVFKEGSVVVVDYTETDLHDRKYYVISNGEGVSIKLYRANPIRFEPESISGQHDTIFPDQNTRVIGRVVRSMNFY